MSTHSGLSRTLGRPTTELDRAREASGTKIYRCVYCRRLMPVNSGRTALPAHELSCDARALVKRQWAMQIEKFTSRQAREAVFSKSFTSTAKVTRAHPALR